jgi:hypothetical protein
LRHDIDVDDKFWFRRLYIGQQIECEQQIEYSDPFGRDDDIPEDLKFERYNCDDDIDRTTTMKLTYKSYQFTKHIDANKLHVDIIVVNQ